MNWGSAILWGFAATVVLTTLLSGSRGLGLTRVDVPYLVGTMFTSDRDRAKRWGFGLHLLNGWIFAFVYVYAFITTGITTWWFGMLIGFVHAGFVLTMGMYTLPHFHPRMASEQYGPDPVKQLEPPGFLALHYGRQTPIATVLAHMVYGAILGYFYHS